MDKKQINEAFEQLAKMDPKPVVIVTERRLGKDEKFYLHKSAGVLGWWNGQEGSFEMRKAERRKLRGASFWWFRPFDIEYIVSVKIITEQELIDNTNILYEAKSCLSDGFKKMK